MANLENQYLKEEMIDDDYVLVDFEDLPEKKSSARNSSQEVDFDNLPEKQGLVRNISGENIYDANPSSKKCAKFPWHIKLKEDISLSDVVKEHVLPFLPAKALCRFRAVSTEWNKWISGPFLCHKQTTNFKDISGLICQSPGSDPSFISFNQDAYGIPRPSLRFLPEHVSIRSTCNGLVCCQSCSLWYLYYICNPVTKKWKALPNSNLNHGPETAIALAFEPTTFNFAAHYELVCAVPVSLNDISVVYFEIYSSRSNTWRIADTVCSEMDALKPDNSGFYMKGVVYWKTLFGVVLAFDLKNEQYGILRLPASSGLDGAFTQMHGELCYMLPQTEDGECLITVYGNLDMSLKYVIPLKPEIVGATVSDCQVLTCVNDDILIILLRSKVIAYHVKAQKVELLSQVRPEGFGNCLPYINTLVPVEK
ncbi:F-box protein [Melia azedarach]|nr:F-box protein [Melia azedarach]